MNKAKNKKNDESKFEFRIECDKSKTGKQFYWRVIEKSSGDCLVESKPLRFFKKAENAAKKIRRIKSKISHSLVKKGNQFALGYKYHFRFEKESDNTVLYLRDNCARLIAQFNMDMLTKKYKTDDKIADYLVKEIRYDISSAKIVNPPTVSKDLL